MTKILILGASGFLGTKLYSVLKEKYEIIGTYNSHKREGLEKLDTTDKTAVNGFFLKHKPDITINTVVLNNIEACEKNKEIAEKVNSLSAGNVAEACKLAKSRLIYISTIYVFSGEKGDYSEKDIPSPVNMYGEIHLKAEQEALNLPNSIIIRSDFIYGYNGKGQSNSFFSDIIKGKNISLNNEQERQPLFIDDAADAIQIMIEKNLSGIFHLAGPDKINKYQLGIRMENLIRKESCITPVTREQQNAPRPKNTTINTEKARKQGVRFHTLKEALDMIRKQLV